MHRVTLRVLVVAILISLMTGTVLASSASAASIGVSRTSVIAGESVRISGALGTRGVRPVRLQRRSGTSWVTVLRSKSTNRGRYNVSARPAGVAGAKNVYRVFAPRVRINGRSLAAVRTATRTVTILAQTAVLTGPAKATIAKPFTMTATLRPVRTGRVTILQRLSGGVWTEIKRGVQTSAGTTSFSVTLPALGSQSLRAIAAASGGAPAKTSNTVAVKVLPPAMQRISESSTGTQTDDWSYTPTVDGNGRYAAFVSNATNLVPNDTNELADVFVRDLETQAVERVSVSSTGEQANGETEGAAISANGRYVVFNSGATNLVPGSPCVSVGCVFLHDRVTGTTETISVPISGNTTGQSYHPSVSGDGSKVAFVSLATNLVPNDTNGKADVFLRNRTTGTTSRISVDSDGGESDGASSFPKISDDGAYVAYNSVATDLVSTDTEGKQDVFLWSEGTQTVQRVSEVAGTGAGGNGISGGGVMSADNRYVLYSSEATNLAADTNIGTDTFRWDRVTRESVIVSLTDAGTQATFADSGPAGISADGRYAAFTAIGFPTAPGETIQTADVFVRDLTAGTTRRISESSTGTNGNGSSPVAAMSSNAAMVVFRSDATNLVPSDTNGKTDIFARDLTR